MVNLRMSLISSLLVLGFFLLNNSLNAQINEQDIEKIEKALPSKAPAQVKEPRKVLVFSLSMGYKHSSIPYVAKTLELMGKKTGAFETVHSNDMSVFMPEQLNQFDAVCFNNTTQLTFDDPLMRKSLMEFVKGGKGVIGIHAATDNFYNWPEAAEMMGGVFAGHPWGSSGTWRIMIEDPESPITKSFEGKDFSVSDEIYRVNQRRLRETSRILVGLDMKDKTNLAAKGVQVTDLDIPISWIRTMGKGRVFYCSFGHNHEIFWNANILKHYLAGIQYALGDLQADATPVPLNIEKVADLNVAAGLLDSISTYEYGQSLESQRDLSSFLRLTSASKVLSAEIESMLIDFLESEATLAGKQYICHVLSIYGTEEAVSVLIDLLENPETAEMALYALERIPANDINEELEDLLEDSEGITKIGIINALGNRRAEEAISEIIPLISNKNPEIASAAIHAVGLIGGDDAAESLSEARSQDKSSSQITDAYLLVADRFAQLGLKDKAYQIYSELNSPTESQQVQYAALRGMILTTEKDVSVVILEAIRSDNENMRSSAIQLVSEIPAGKDVSAIARLLPELPASLQVQLLASLSGRSESSVVKSMMTQVKSDNEAVQIAALKSLSMSGNAETVPLFAEIAASGKGKIRATARTALYRLNGPEVNESIMKNASSASPVLKIEYIRAIAARQMTDGIPFLFKSLEDNDSKIRMESLKSLRAIATPRYMNEALTNLVQPKTEQERKELERIVIAIAAQIPDGKPKSVLVVEKFKVTKDVKAKASMLEVLGKIGDPESLTIIRASLNDKDPEIKTAAIRALTYWPDSEPLDDLLNVAKTSRSEKSRILALRGYVKLIAFKEDKSREEVLAMYQTAMELASNTEEKRAVLSGLSTVISLDALEFTAAYIDDTALQQEAVTTIITIASEIEIDEIRSEKSLLNKSLTIVKNEDLRETCLKIINELEKFEDFITLWQVAGPYENQEVDIFAFAFPPESGESVKWQKVPEDSDKDNYWHVNLGTVLKSSGPVAYLRNKVLSEKDQEVQLQVGSNDGVKVWLNGELVHTNNTARGVTPGEDKVNVKIKKGSNIVLIKIINVGGAWGACARFRTLDGGKLDGLKFELGE